ncbi:hypothetical protein [Kitasatospora sp. NPDC088346]|uniref:hypothetical protein n=1 Tax=Kitasatospora sp. NPDC088346 TaxID=3364073 RepID=UPI00381B70EE
MAVTTRARRGRLLLAANAVFAAVSAAFCVAAALDPGLLLPDAGTGAGSYALAYAARQLPLSGALVLLLARGRRSAPVPLLAVSGVAQLGDALLGLGSGIPGVAAGGGVGAALHLATAWHLRRTAHHPSTTPTPTPATT